MPAKFQLESSLTGSHGTICLQIDLSWAKLHVPAILSAGYGGEYGGQAVADVVRPPAPKR